MFVIFTLVVVAGGCGGDQPSPEPELTTPVPRYQQIPEDLCDQVRVEDVAERFGLSMFPRYERISNYSTERTFWHERCRFHGLAEDGRFATQLEDFRPAGAVTVLVYYELPDAEAGYEQTASGSFEHRTETQPGATTAEITGWWDAGMSLQWVEEIDPDSYRGTDRIANVVVSHLVRHENLVVEGYLRAVCPTEESAEALAFLHDLQSALVDEAVEHLTLTTG